MGITKKNQKKLQETNLKNAPVPKRNSLRKKVLTFLAILGGIVIIWLAFLLFGNNYKSNALQMKINATMAYRISSHVLNDYLNNWILLETDKVGKNADGLLVSTDNASEVLKWRSEFFKKNGTSKLLDNVLGQMEECHDKLNLTPAKYRDTQDSFDRLCKHVKSLTALTIEPGDSLVLLASQMSDLKQKIKDDLEASDFNFLISYDDLKAKAEELSSSISDKDVADALMKDVVDKSNSAINAMKYKKMDFRELPHGNGVLYKEISRGKGRKPKDDSQVKLHYEGKLMDGSVFDSSYKRGQPAIMRPSQTVPGFWHALTSMKEGAKWEIFIPYSQAYGDRSAGAVKPYSDLFFTIEILGLDN